MTSIQDVYERIGGSYEDALSRLMNESFIERFALKYLQDDTFQSLQSAIAAGSIPDQFRAAHNLKGVSANLSFMNLQAAAHELTEQLRPQTEPADANLVAAVAQAHDQVVQALRAYAYAKEGAAASPATTDASSTQGVSNKPMTDTAQEGGAQ